MANQVAAFLFNTKKYIRVELSLIDASALYRDYWKTTSLSFHFVSKIQIPFRALLTIMNNGGQ
jgi:hypothetical protein